MHPRMKRLALVATLLLTPTAAWAQFGWKHVQRWTPPRASFESRVRGCTMTQPFAHIAADDWICGQSGPIVRYTWWGTLTNPAQGHRPYYIAVYRTLTGACQPDLSQPLWARCLVPDVVRYVGTDCQQRRVYRMSAGVPATMAPFIQTTGTRYWLQVSEADNESIQPNVENFRWSGRRPIVFCPAIQFPPMTQPILDACDGSPDDLSFALQSRDISGTITFPPGVVIRNPLLLSLYDTAGNLREELTLEPGDDGSYSVNPESEDGMYVLELTGLGMLPVRATVQLQDNQCNRVSFFDVFYGDLTNDDQIAIDDLALMLSNFGRVFP